MPLGEDRAVFRADMHAVVLIDEHQQPIDQTVRLLSRKGGIHHQFPVAVARDHADARAFQKCVGCNVVDEHKAVFVPVALRIVGVELRVNRFRHLHHAVKRPVARRRKQIRFVAEFVIHQHIVVGEQSEQPRGTADRNIARNKVHRIRNRYAVPQLLRPPRLLEIEIVALVQVVIIARHCSHHTVAAVLHDHVIALVRQQSRLHLLPELGQKVIGTVHEFIGCGFPRKNPEFSPVQIQLGERIAEISVLVHVGGLNRIRRRRVGRPCRNIVLFPAGSKQSACQQEREKHTQQFFHILFPSLFCGAFIPRIPRSKA